MRHTFSLWAEGRSLEAHVAYQEEQLARGTESIIAYAGLVEGNGGLCASLKRFSLSMRIGDETIPTVGLGAIMVPPPQRRGGVGRALIEATLDAARESGARLAWLFSEIDPAYYARFGFREVEWPIFAGEVRDLPSGSDLVTRSSKGAFSDQDLAMAERLEADRFAELSSTVRPAREARARSYFAWRNAYETVWLSRPDKTVVGYVALSSPAERAEDTDSMRVLEVADWAWSGLDDGERLSALRALAEARGATHVVGPLGEDGAKGLFARFSSDAHGAPMLATLDPTLELPEATPSGKLPSSRVHFGLCDYF